jgi:hypothetical protein
MSVTHIQKHRLSAHDFESRTSIAENVRLLLTVINGVFWTPKKIKKEIKSETRHDEVSESREH